MKNQQLGNMVTKVEIVHIIHNALVLCVIDLGGGGYYYTELEVLESKLLVVDWGKLLQLWGSGGGNHIILNVLRKLNFNMLLEIISE